MQAAAAAAGELCIDILDLQKLLGARTEVGFQRPKAQQLVACNFLISSGELLYRQ